MLETKNSLIDTIARSTTRAEVADKIHVLQMGILGALWNANALSFKGQYLFFFRTLVASTAAQLIINWHLKIASTIDGFDYALASFVLDTSFAPCKSYASSQDSLARPAKVNPFARSIQILHLNIIFYYQCAQVLWCSELNR